MGDEEISGGTGIGQGTGTNTKPVPFDPVIENGAAFCP